MDHLTWEELLELARYVRTNPLFDREERERKSEIAAGLRRAIRGLAAGDGSLDRIDAVLRSGAHYSLPAQHQYEWFARWASRDRASLVTAIAEFAAPETTASERFSRFASFAERVDAAQPAQPGGILAFGSLFNFAFESRDLPCVNAFLFERLEEMLGHDPPTGSAAEQYAGHLEFASAMQRRLLEAKLPIRDMLDVQALILICSRDLRVWISAASDAELQRRSKAAPPQARDSAIPYLSVCACLGYDAPYLEEWLEFHRAVGVERFFLYNNGDRERQRELLAPYVEDGIVILHDWPVNPPQIAAFQNCLREHAGDSRWIAFMDTDEFLFSPAGEPLPTVLRGYERWPGIGVCRAHYGPSGHETKPPDLVIESYVERLAWGDTNVKSIVDPSRVTACVHPHFFVYAEGEAVDENEHPIKGWRTTFASFDRIRMNHYMTRSVEEFRVKSAYLRADTGGPRASKWFENTLRGFEIFGRRDDVILRWAPAVRERLAQLRPSPHATNGVRGR